MVKDINIGTGDSNHYSTTIMGNNLYFTSNDGINGYELWVSDGTEAGTMMVKDINTGSGSSSPNHHTVVDSTLYFQANSGNGYELWKSDGTSTGTIMVKNINSGTANGWPNYFLIGSIGNTLYFTATDVDGPAIWESDGTTTGTVKIVSLPNDCYPGSELVASGELYCLVSNSNGDKEGLEIVPTVPSTNVITYGQLHNLDIICDYDSANTYGYPFENWTFIHGNEQYLIILDANADMSLVKISI
jgi:ELWxxDGT repeat protein